jgi:hypothetical protein
MKREHGTEKPGAAGAEWPYFCTRICDLKAAGAAWANPKDWLEQALRSAGRDAAEAASIMAQLSEVFGVESAVKLAAYDEAKRLYTQMVRDG